MKGFKFEKLIIWQKSMEMGEPINLLAHNFPKEEVYNLSSQIRKVDDSIALNIEKGSIGQSNLESKKFIGYSIRSLAEVVTCLFKATNRSYINQEDFLKEYELAYSLMNMMIVFRDKID